MTYMCGAGTAYPSVAPGLQRPTCVEQELLTLPWHLGYSDLHVEQELEEELLTFRGTWVTATYMCGAGTAYPSVAPGLERPTCVEQELLTFRGT